MEPIVTFQPNVRGLLDTFASFHQQIPTRSHRAVFSDILSSLLENDFNHEARVLLCCRADSTARAHGTIQKIRCCQFQIMQNRITSFIMKKLFSGFKHSGVTLDHQDQSAATELEEVELW